MTKRAEERQNVCRRRWGGSTALAEGADGQERTMEV